MPISLKLVMPVSPKLVLYGLFLSRNFAASNHQSKNQNGSRPNQKKRNPAQRRNTDVEKRVADTIVRQLAFAGRRLEKCGKTYRGTQQSRKNGKMAKQKNEAFTGFSEFVKL
jgi:hypothetical protein